MPNTRLTAMYAGVCVECGNPFSIGTEIKPGPPGTGGWAHAVCPEDELRPDDRLRCYLCGDLLTPDYECENCGARR